MALVQFNFRTVNFVTGAGLPGAAWTIYFAGTTTKAPLYDYSANLIANPLFADANAYVAFSLPDSSVYDVVYSLGTYVSPVFQIGLNDLLLASSLGAISSALAIEQSVRQTADANLQLQIGAVTGGQTLLGGWNAAANSPALTSSVGTRGNYYVVTTAGTTSLNGETGWQVGDEALFTGTVWIRVPFSSAIGLTYDTKAAFVAGAPILSTTNYVSVRTVAGSWPPAANQIAYPLTYRRNASATGLFGEVAKDGAFWTPLYSRNPVLAGEFGAVPDATVPIGGAAFTGTANGTTTVAVANTSGLAVGMNVAQVNYASLALTNVPSGTTITGIVANTSITVSNAVAAGTLKLAGYWLISTTTVTGTNNLAALTAFLDFKIANNCPRAEIGLGTYRVDGTLHVGRGDTFHGVTLRGGDRPAYDPSMAGATLVFTQPDRPALSVQGARLSRVAGLAIIGPNANYADYAQGFNNVLSSDERDWLAPELTRSGSAPGGLQTNSPLAGITIDAYAGSAPSAPYPIDGVTFYGRALSSGVEIEQCVIRGFAVGVCAGFVASQGDFIRVRNNTFQGVIYNIAHGGSQSRNVEVRNNVSSSLHTFVTGSRFGAGGGEFGGPIENNSIGSAYQIADFNGLGNSGVLTFKNMYCENTVRFGRIKATGSYSADTVIEGCNFIFDDSIHGRVVPYYIEAGGAQNIILRNNRVFGSQRLTSLVGGTGPGQHKLIIEGGNYIGATRGTASSAARQAAINYCGGLLAGSPIANPSTNRGLDVRSGYFGAFYATVGDSGNQLFYDANVKFDIDGLRASLTQATQNFIDRVNRPWRIEFPETVVLNFSDAATVTAPAAWSGDVMTFGYAAYNNGGIYDLVPGRMLLANSSATLFVVTAVSAAVSGVKTVTCRQENNIIADSAGNYVSNTLSPLAVTGNVIIIPSGVTLPRQVFYGNFTSGSTTVSSVSRPDGFGGNMASYLVAGDVLFGPQNYGADSAWPIAQQGSAINTVTPGSPGSLTLTVAASATGRFPIYPVVIR